MPAVEYFGAGGSPQRTGGGTMSAALDRLSFKGLAEIALVTDGTAIDVDGTVNVAAAVKVNAEADQEFL